MLTCMIRYDRNCHEAIMFPLCSYCRNGILGRGRGSRVAQFSESESMPPYLEFRGLSDRLADAERDRSIASVLIHVAAIATNTPVQEVKASSRATARGARARQIAIYLASVTLEWRCERLSLAFGRARSTVTHACQRVENLRDEPRFDALLEAYEAWVRGMRPLIEGVLP